MCNCLDDIFEKVKTKVVSGLPAHDPDSLDMMWENCAISFSHSGSVLTVPIKYSYRKIKKDGSRAQNLSKNRVIIRASHCPFCGEKFPSKEG